MSAMLQDLKFAVRMLVKSPGFTAVAILTLGLGIGANTAIFSVVNAVLLRPLPFKNYSQLVVLRETYKLVGNVSVSYPDFLDWRQQAHSFSAMAAIQNRGFNLSGVAQPENIGGYAVSPNLPALLRRHPGLGAEFARPPRRPPRSGPRFSSFRRKSRNFPGHPPQLSALAIASWRRSRRSRPLHQPRRPQHLDRRHSPSHIPLPRSHRRPRPLRRLRRGTSRTRRAW